MRKGLHIIRALFPETRTSATDDELFPGDDSGFASRSCGCTWSWLKSKPGSLEHFPCREHAGYPFGLPKDGPPC